ncbi:hypothetical protein SAMN06265784_12059 [Paraburkholderia susongensis]|uniref:Uncharacterized protein n=1 Tax=Paraburkholderia susongensis TaxID=1515439 RepID=A0A1X7M5E7_9BURK|nr:hypothetical protein SAMN06265784_12059 [Paraburkholderia susongensis]
MTCSTYSGVVISATRPVPSHGYTFLASPLCDYGIKHFFEMIDILLQLVTGRDL